MALPWTLHQGQSGTGALKNPPAPPQKLEEVLVVVGGRVLEDEDEERALEMPAVTRNFAFYNPKSSKCTPLPPPPFMLLSHLSTLKPSLV